MPNSSAGILRQYGNKIGFLYRLLDAAIILATLNIALFITHGETMDQQYALAGSWAVLLFLVTSTANHLYGSWRMDSLHSAATAALASWFWSALLLVFFVFLTKTSNYYFYFVRLKNSLMCTPYDIMQFIVYMRVVN